MLIFNTKSKQKTPSNPQNTLPSQKGIIRYHNEKLKAEIEQKNKELASNNIHLLQKTEFLQKLREELIKLDLLIDNKAAKKELKRIIYLLDEDFQRDEEWDQFIHHFDEVYDEFFKKLKAEYPKLTLKDHKLCAFLRMNLSTKEMAPLMNISVRGVEISRYRLRKKLDLDSSINLNEFMMEF